MMSIAHEPDRHLVIPPGSVGGEVAATIRRRLERRRAEMVDQLGELVELESGSDDPQGLVAVAGLLEERLAPFGSVVRYPSGVGTHHLMVSVPGETALPHTLVLGHFDTVWPRGTTERLPFRVDDDGRAWGPGTFDMKGGLTLLVFTLQEMRLLDRIPRRPLRIVLNCDEEIRSRTSRKLISGAASGAAAALVLEAPLPEGVVKTARKGTATFRVRIGGRAAHAGIEPEKGRSAVAEMVHQIPAIHALNDWERGTTVNIGVVRAGTRPNVVAATAELEIDVRVRTAAEAARVDAGLRSLMPVTDGTTIDVEADLTRPPMERTAATAALFHRARMIAAGMGVDRLEEGSTGGASDGNLVAAAGVPTLDGLGPEGDGAHADHEHVDTASMPTRAALLAGLLVEI